MNNPEILSQLRKHLSNGRPEQVRSFCEGLHPATIADYLSELSLPEGRALFAALSERQRADVIMRLSRPARRGLVRGLRAEEVGRLMTAMHHDERVDLLRELPSAQAQQALRTVAASEREDMLKLAAYPEGTAGALMTSEFVHVREGLSAAQALDYVRAQVADQDNVSQVFVVDADGRLIGSVSLARLLAADGPRPIAELAEPLPAVVRPETADREAANLLNRYDLTALPVLDNGDRLLGVVSFDDVLAFVEEDASETMLRKAGMGDPRHARDTLYSEQLIRGPVLYPVRVRILFLLVTLAGGLAVGGLIDQFEDTLAALLATAVFIPLIMDMGGNVGTQSTTIFARGLALGHIDPSRILWHIRREVSVGLIMGAILGAIGGTIAYFWQGIPNGLPALGLAVGISLAVVIPFATLLGFLLPWLLLKLGLDHAPGADPFITTIKDFTGLALYFFLVNAFLGAAS